VRGSLVGHGIRPDATLEQRVQHVDDVAEQRHRNRLGVFLGGVE
jgi:hypothetical protein